MFYLDSNIFILPILYEGKKADLAKSVLKAVVKGRIEAATSALTFDEVAWVLTKKHSREIAIENIELIQKFPHLRILDVKKRDVLGMTDLMKENPKIAPRDAIHISVSISNGIKMIISDDDDFSNIEGIDHIDLEHIHDFITVD